MIKTFRSRVTQACEHCRRLKLKCSSGNPCNRCRDANIQCQYSVNRRKHKSAITNTELYRLQTKQKVLEETFQRVQTLLKMYNNTNITLPSNLSSEDFFELYFESSDKLQQHQFFRTPSSSPKLQEFHRILTGNFVNPKELSLVAPTMKQAQHEFYQKLVDIYLNYNFHNFPILLRKDLYQLLDQRDYDSSIILQGVFSISFKLFYGKNSQNPKFENHFYTKLKGMIKNWQNVLELEYIKGCMLATVSELGMGLGPQSATSMDIVTRLGLTLGFDKISNNFSYYQSNSRWLDIYLIWLSSITYERFRCIFDDLPTTVPVNLVTIPLALPDVLSPNEKLDIKDTNERFNFIYYIQTTSMYCMATTMYQISKLHRQLKSTDDKKDYNQITNDFNQLYERIEAYSVSSIFYPINYEFSESDLKNKNMMYSKFILTNMYRLCFIKFAQLIQDYYYNYCIPCLSNPLELTINNELLQKLHYFQNQGQLMIISFTQLANQLKKDENWLQIKHAIYYSSLTMAYIIFRFCQFLVTDLSLLGKTLFKFCYEELLQMGEIWPLANEWISILSKNYESIII